MSPLQAAERKQDEMFSIYQVANAKNNGNEGIFQKVKTGFLENHEHGSSFQGAELRSHQVSPSLRKT